MYFPHAGTSGRVVGTDTSIASNASGTLDIPPYPAKKRYIKVLSSRPWLFRWADDRPHKKVGRCADPREMPPSKDMKAL